MFKLLQHLNLKELDDAEVGWSFRHVPETIPLSTLSDLSCIEVRIDTIGNDDLLYKKASRWLDEVAWGLAESGLGQSFLVQVAFELSPKSRVKSYKGIFRRGGEIKSGEYCEEEIEIERQSVFIGTARISDENKTESLRIARHILRSFVILSEEASAQSLLQYLKKPLVDCLMIKTAINIDYPELIPIVVHSNQALVTFGIGARDNYVNLRLFVHKSQKQQYVQALVSIITSLEAQLIGNQQQGKNHQSET
jgi:hypothetical protein